LNDIFDFGGGRWGVDAAAEYLLSFESTYALLRAHPSAGRQRPELGAYFRSIRRGSHLLFYRLENDVVTITRILHASADPDGQVD
jgi:toxin ParE1/3/4